MTQIQEQEEKKKDLATFISMWAVAILPFVGTIIVLGNLKDFGFLSALLGVVISGIASVLILFLLKALLGKFWGPLAMVLILFLAYVVATDQAGSLTETAGCVSVGADLVWLMIFYFFADEDDEASNPNNK